MTLAEHAVNIPIGRVRPWLTGGRAAVSAADPQAVGAAVAVIDRGGNAVDATIAAQAVLCVVAPQACGLGGDAMVLVARSGEPPVAVNGTGTSASRDIGSGAGATITVPGIVDAWAELSVRFGQVPLDVALAPAVVLADEGCVVTTSAARAAQDQRQRLDAGGASTWVMAAADAGRRVRQPELAMLLRAVGAEPRTFYEGAMADAMSVAIARNGGTLDASDLAGHRTPVSPPVSVSFGPAVVHVQPPSSQGVLLAMALQWLHDNGLDAAPLDAHTAIELLGAVFEHRAAAGDGVGLLDVVLDVDRGRASGRSGARAYLHTAGVAVADRDGTVVSSLVSVFDDFGSGVYVPELGITLNNRADGFTVAPNDAAPGKRPVHTLAPVIVETGDRLLALATPGADGQVQTLLQVLLAGVDGATDMPTAIARPRWRSQDGALLIEEGHGDIGALAGLGHDVRVLPDGDDLFGSVVAAGYGAGTPTATGDWRRSVWAGAL